MAREVSTLKPKSTPVVRFAMRRSIGLHTARRSCRSAS